MQYKLTIPNDYGSEGDYKALEQWCRQQGVEMNNATIFDAADSVWLDGKMLAEPFDFSQAFESPTPPPTDSPDWPPLWVTQWNDETEQFEVAIAQQSTVEKWGAK